LDHQNNKKQEQNKKHNINDQRINEPIDNRKVKKERWKVVNTHHKFRSSNQIMPNFARWRHVNLQPIKTAMKQPNQPKTESINNQNDKQQEYKKVDKITVIKKRSNKKFDKLGMNLQLFHALS